MNVLIIFLISSFSLLMSQSIPDGSIIVADQAGPECTVYPQESDWTDQNKIWSWSPQDSPEIPINRHTWFNAVSDCKRVLAGTHLIAAASGGMLALVRVEDKKAIYHGYRDGNLHSVEILPDTNMVAISSTGGKLGIYYTGSGADEDPEVSYDIANGHGVVWDHQRQLLWAYGGNTLKMYQYNFDKQNPALTELRTFINPIGGGHDLFPIPGEDQLFYTTNCCVGFFDISDSSFNQYPPLANVSSVKSVSMDTTNGQVIYLKPTTSWWSPTVLWVDGSEKTHTGGRIYKARWWVPNAFSYPEDISVLVFNRETRTPYNHSNTELEIFNGLFIWSFNSQNYETNGKLIKP